ncbi:non-specific serine/threonine protein kinase [Salvia divinorum]|uniref:Non-specific serine/threonine protein kinase n=1 Tax=Salvia divinorum TaxID=28513 RepID=A0ABD1FIK7_SALDI
MASFQYNFSNRIVKDLSFQFDTDYPEQNPVLRLTKTDENGNALPWSTGRILYSRTIPFGPAVDFKTTVKFTVKRNVSNSSPIADGLAFFIVPEGHTFPEGTSPPPGGNFGLFDPSGKSSNVFAVAFDTLLGTPNSVSFGIDIQVRKPVAKRDVPYSFVGKELTLVVSYDGATRAISASITDGSVPFPNAAVHDVHYWEFNSTAP